MKKSRRTQEQILQDDYSDYLDRWLRIHLNDSKPKRERKALTEGKARAKGESKQVKRKRTQAEILEDGFDRLLNIGTNLYKNKPVKNSIFDLSTNLYNNKSTKNSIFDLSTELYKTRAPKVKEHSEEKKQLGKAKSAIDKSTPIIEFDLTKMKNIDYFFVELPNILYELLDTIELDKDTWCVVFDYGSGWKYKPLTSICGKLLEDQIQKEIVDKSYDYTFDEHDYDFFPYGIRSLKRLSIVNYSKVGTYKLKRALKKLGIVLPDNENKTKPYNKREGRFWKWYLTYKEIDLSRYMIFHKLGKEEVTKVERDNCFIFACAQAGLDNKILDDLRYNIMKRSIATSDITRAAEACDLKIRVKLENGNTNVIGNGSHEIKLLLLKNHYMVNERVKVSPYYIKHRDEINSDKVARYWKQSDRMLIYKKCNGYYKKGVDFSLRKVLLALFEVNAFTPIRIGDYMTFNSLICFEKIDPIKNLEYSPKFCCRLKEDWKSNKI